MRVNSHTVEVLARDRIDAMLTDARLDRVASRASSRASVFSLSSTARYLKAFAGAIEASMTLARRPGGSARTEGNVPQMMGRNVSAFAVMAIVASTGACAVGQPVSSGTASASSATARPIASPGLESEPLSAGTWRTEQLRTQIEFSVDDGEWIVTADAERFALLRRPDAGPNGLVFVWIENVFREPCEQGWEGGTMPWPDESRPQDLFTWLAEQSPTEFGSPEPATIGGRDALSMERVIPNGAFDSCADGYFPMVDVAVEPPGDIGLPRYGQRFTLAAVDAAQAPTLILAFAEDGPAFGEHAASVDALLDSLHFVVDE